MLTLVLPGQYAHMIKMVSRSIIVICLILMKTVASGSEKPSIRCSPRTCSTGQEQLYIKSAETSFSMEQEVESLIRVSNGYLY